MLDKSPKRRSKSETTIAFVLYSVKLPVLFRLLVVLVVLVLLFLKSSFSLSLVKLLVMVHASVSMVRRHNIRRFWNMWELLLLPPPSLLFFFTGYVPRRNELAIHVHWRTFRFLQSLAVGWVNMFKISNASQYMDMVCSNLSNAILVAVLRTCQKGIS